MISSLQFVELKLWTHFWGIKISLASFVVGVNHVAIVTVERYFLILSQQWGIFMSYQGGIYIHKQENSANLVSFEISKYGTVFQE